MNESTYSTSYLQKTIEELLLEENAELEFELASAEYDVVRSVSNLVERWNTLSSWN